MLTISKKLVGRVLLVLAAVTYAGFLWEAVLGFPLEPSRSYLSELAARDQASGHVFRMLDALTGVCIVLGVLLLRRARASSHACRPEPLAVLSGGSLAVFGVLTTVDAFVPMACATSANLACARADAAGQLGLAHELHAVTSGAASVAVLVSSALLCTLALRARSSPRAARWTAVVGAGLLCLFSAIVTLVAVIGAPNGSLPAGGGYLQRGQVLVISGYVASYAGLIGVFVRSHAPSPRSPDSEVLEHRTPR